MRPLPATGQQWRRKKDGRTITIGNDLSPRGDWIEFTFKVDETGRTGRMWRQTLYRGHELIEGAPGGS